MRLFWKNAFFYLLSSIQDWETILKSHRNHPLFLPKKCIFTITCYMREHFCVNMKTFKITFYFTNTISNDSWFSLPNIRIILVLNFVSPNDSTRFDVPNFHWLTHSYLSSSSLCLQTEVLLYLILMRNISISGYIC